MKHNYYEFFAGGGMARAGLGTSWSCAFANDVDPKKAASYMRNWGGDEMKLGDVASLRTGDLPGRADLAWASFPCQDLSLAGAGAGLDGHRSGAFWPFWRLIEALGAEGRAPRIVVLENVPGALTSHGGRDFAAIAGALAAKGYRFGALMIDAARFVPQSRPRLFVVGVTGPAAIPADCRADGPASDWHPRSVLEAVARLSSRCREGWVWWRLPGPPDRGDRLADLIEENPCGVTWHALHETRKLLEMMSPLNRGKVEAAKKAGRRVVGAVYKRTRSDGSGAKAQRAEIRFDDLAGCLRTPGGGSSRQSILVVEASAVRSRLLSPREAARLMGLPEDYRLPDKYNDAYHLAGDGVVVPVVRHLAGQLLEPILAANRARAAA